MYKQNYLHMGHLWIYALMAVSSIYHSRNQGGGGLHTTLKLGHLKFPGWPQTSYVYLYLCLHLSDYFNLTPLVSLVCCRLIEIFSQAHPSLQSS